MEQCDITSWFLFCGRTERDREKFKHKSCGHFPSSPMISVKTKFRKMARRSNLYRFETNGRHLKMRGKISVSTEIIRRVFGSRASIQIIFGHQKVAPNNWYLWVRSVYSSTYVGIWPPDFKYKYHKVCKLIYCAINMYTETTLMLIRPCL